MRYLILNGPNLNMIGLRNHKYYGEKTLDEVNKEIEQYCLNKKIEVSFFQSNSESEIIDYLQKHYNDYDKIVANLGAYTHYSYAIRDALELTNATIAEVHISNINNRESFRKISVIEDISKVRVIGKGTDGYIEAIKLLEELKWIKK